MWESAKASIGRKAAQAYRTVVSVICVQALGLAAAGAQELLNGVSLMNI